MPAWINYNSIHNALNSVILLAGAWAGFDFTVFGFGPTAAGKIIAACGFTKLTMNALRDGLAGMVKEQPPVK